MRTRLNKWLDITTKVGKRTTRVTTRVLYGVDVHVMGRWHHAHKDGEPMIFNTEHEAQAARAELRKQPAPLP